MMITEEMIAEDEKRWNDRNIVAELGYCGKNIRHRKNITKDDIRFYAYIMRKAHAMLKEQEPKAAIITHQNEYCKDGNCPSCGHELDDNMHPKYCGYCGQAVEWNV